MSNRQLAAVMVTDIVGYTILMANNQDNALKLVNRSHEIIKASVLNFGGKWLEHVGDRSYTTFPSAISAVNCALQVQERLEQEPELSLRIGIDVGEVLVTDDKVYGETVNIASTVERLAEPEGLVITETVFKAVHGQIELNELDMGEKVLKGVSDPVRLYTLATGSSHSQSGNFVSNLMLRRVPHITGAYLAAVWIVIEATDLLAGNGLFDQSWVYNVSVCLLTLIPSVLLIAYVHGAHGRDRVTRTEKVGVPVNLVFSFLLATFTSQNDTTYRYDDTPIDSASIAVLKFVNLSEDQGSAYFSSGLSEELINALAKVPSLYVASRSSSFIFDGPGVDPREVAKKLRVATILEGSVRKQGNRVRITAQLIDGQNNYHLWTETYDRELDDIFQIQEDIALSVASELLGILKPSAPVTLSSRGNVKAYDLYLRGLNFLRQPVTEISLASARDLFNRALTEDNNYAQAYAALCEVALKQYLINRSSDLINAAESNCSQALVLDKDLREVRSAMGVLYRHTGEYEKSADIFRKLLEDQPTASTWVSLGQTLEAQGAYNAAEIAFRSAVSREPGNWRNSLALAEFLHWQDRHQNALETLNHVIDLSPSNARAHLLIGSVQGNLGNRDKQLRATLKSIELHPTGGAYRDLGLAYYYMGDFERAASAYRSAIDIAPENHWVWGNLAHVLMLSGQPTEAKQAYTSAAEFAEAALEKNPKDWLALSLLAVYNVANGATEEGLQQIGTALAEGAHLSEVHYHHATVRLMLDQRAQAIDALEIAIEKGLPMHMVSQEPTFAVLETDDRFSRLISQ